MEMNFEFEILPYPTSIPVSKINKWQTLDFQVGIRVRTVIEFFIYLCKFWFDYHSEKQLDFCIVMTPLADPVWFKEWWLRIPLLICIWF